MKRTSEILGALLLILFSCQSALAQANSDLPGDPARVNYEMAFLYLIRDEPDAARPYLESAAQAGGAFGDLARIELVRLDARVGDGPAALAAVRNRTMSLEDRTLLPRAWLAGAQALAASGRRREAFEFAAELSLRFPAAEEALRALLLAARLARAEERDDAAADLLLRAVRDYSHLPGADEAYLTAARLYLEPGPRLNPFRACGFLTRMLQTPHFAASPLRPDAVTLSAEFCGFDATVTETAVKPPRNSY